MPLMSQARTWDGIRLRAGRKTLDIKLNSILPHQARLIIPNQLYRLPVVELRCSRVWTLKMVLVDSQRQSRLLIP